MDNVLEYEKEQILDRSTRSGPESLRVIVADDPNISCGDPTI
jgi:hypothetical protein